MPRTINTPRLMKTLIMILSLLADSVGAFAQGKVTLALDFPLVMDPSHCLAADAALAGQAIPTTGPLPSGVILQIGLYGGTSSGSLAMISSESINPVGGNGLPAGAI